MAAQPYETLVEAQKNLMLARGDLELAFGKLDVKDPVYIEKQTSWTDKMGRASATIILFKNALDGMRNEAGDKMPDNIKIITDTAIGFLAEASNLLVFNFAGAGNIPKGEPTGPLAVIAAHQKIEFARGKILELVNSGLPDKFKDVQDLLKNAV